MFLVVGEVIGVLPTIALIILTALLGTALLRQQGLAAFHRLQDDLRSDRIPAAAIGHALAIAIAGALLLTPGFITDGVGFLLFIPAVRHLLWRLILSSVKAHRLDPKSGMNVGPGAGAAGPHRPETIDLDTGDYEPSDHSSPWRGNPDR